MTRELYVNVSGRSSGLLSVGAHQEHTFNYAVTADESGFVSLTMPVRHKGYTVRGLHPIFEMQLPEGYLRAVLQRHFSKLTETDDFGLLQLLAPSIKGRLTYRTEPEVTPDALLLQDLLSPNSASLFQRLVERFALYSPLSGVQPKVLAHVENKAALTTDQYIVKTWGGDYPELALNEYLCMSIVKAAGIPVPEFYLSDDRSLFIMKRFDLLDDGRPVGFEDMCVLQGKGREDKYSGSYEQVAKSILTFVAPAFRQRSMEQYFKMLVLNTLLENGDAHLKNFGVLYEDENSVRLAPAYDVVSTTCYIPNDIAALNLQGSKRWWGRDQLVRVGQSVCELSKVRAQTLYQCCIESMKSVEPLIDSYSESTDSADALHILSTIRTRIARSTDSF